MTPKVRGQVRLAEEIPPDLLEINNFATLREANERALVILAMGRPYWIFKIGHSYHLCVRPADVEAVAEQLALSEAENRNWPPPTPQMPTPQPSGKSSLLVFAGLMCGFFILQGSEPVYWREAGLMNNEEVITGGQWWRLVTALTLHADIGHLASNVLAGICFGLLLNRTFGYGLGWTLILTGGILGNLINAWFFYPELHRSLGASTAVFAALGILVGQALWFGFNREAGLLLRRRLIPLAAGLMMLAFTGVGGENTDITAHVFGFAVGIPLGAATAAATRHQVPGLPVQRTLAAMVCLVLLLSWVLAVS